MRAHSEDSALEIVAGLIESETANRKPGMTNMSEPWPGYRAGLAASQGRIYTGGSWCCPGGGTASESKL